ncbi:MAG TPA: hypothetical protein PK640_21540, partial [Verrucomicrobiota bacterium]|nr:hypothetical protein [Verrucomicrobiota bacterium]
MGSIPDGYIYVPAGRFLFVSRDVEALRLFLRSEPMHTVATGAYLIAREEVTYAEYIEFLDAIPAPERAARIAAGASSP